MRLDRVVLDQLVADRRVENLAEPRQRLVDRSVGQRALDLAQLAFADLGGLVAVDLLRGDLREPVVLEEGQQVMGQRQLVVLDRPRRELVAARLKPLGGELVEGRLGRRLGRRAGSLGLQMPRRTSARTLASSSSAFSRLQPSARGAERHVAALAVGAEAKGEGAPALPLQLDHLPCRSACHLAYLMRPPEVDSPRRPRIGSSCTRPSDPCGWPARLPERAGGSAAGPSPTLRSTRAAISGSNRSRGFAPRRA